MANSYRILHADNDALTRDLVALSLGLDPAVALLSCETGAQALRAAPDWAPDLIVSEVKLPDMDGPTLLARLAADPATDRFPVVFTSTCAQDRDVEALRALGALGVIAKPFDPVTLPLTLRRYLYSLRMNAAGYDFRQRLERDAAALSAFRQRPQDPALLTELQSFAHKLAGAAGVFNFRAVSDRALALELAIIELRAGQGASQQVTASLDALLACVERA